MTRDPQIIGRGIALGVVNSLLISLVMVPLFLSGIPPMPEPPSLVFAQVVLGAGVPMAVGQVFHVAYGTFWSAVWVALDYPRLRPSSAAVLAALLWIIALLILFPINGWGLLGLEVGDKVFVAALGPHILFALFLWGLGKLFFRPRGRLAMRGA